MAHCISVVKKCCVLIRLRNLSIDVNVENVALILVVMPKMCRKVRLYSLSYA